MNKEGREKLKGKKGFRRMWGGLKEGRMQCFLNCGMKLKLTLKKLNLQKYLNKEQSIFILRIMRGLNAKNLAVYRVNN